MRSNYLLIPLIAFTLTACGNSNVQPTAKNAVTENVDNTGINVRDRNGVLPTAQDQEENAADRLISQKIRRAIVDDNTLSTDAKNVKVITQNGVVTLRGPVNTAQEKNVIGEQAKSVAGVNNINNQLEVIQK